jgi:hypothetical protein
MALTFTDEQSAKLLEVLGLPADTTDIDLILDTVNDLAAQATGIDPEKPSTVAAAARKAGLEVVDTQTLTALRHGAQEGRKIAAAATQQKIEAAVDDAVSKGKIAPSRRKHWVTLCRHDAGHQVVIEPRIVYRTAFSGPAGQRQCVCVQDGLRPRCTTGASPKDRSDAAYY